MSELSSGPAKGSSEEHHDGGKRNLVRERKKRWGLLVFVAVVVFSILFLIASSIPAAPLPPYSSENKRFCFGVVQDSVEGYNVSRLNAGWYVTFAFDPDPPSLSGLELAQTINLWATGYSPHRSAIEDYAAAHPGTLWFVGNEPDSPLQSNVTPLQYARLYHELYPIIKEADPTAQIAIGGVIQATPLRLQYLDMVLDTYQALYGEKMPVDVWNVHGFILQEKRGYWGAQIPPGMSVDEGTLYAIDDHDNMTIFRQQIRDFRQWMRDRGERNKPLVISEYGILFPIDLGFDEARVENFMIATFDYFLNATSSWLGYPDDGNRLVQAWCWYSLDDDDFEGHESYSHLFDPDTKWITPLGRAYSNYTSALLP